MLHLDSMAALHEGLQKSKKNLIAASLLSKKSAMNVLLVVLTALLSSPSTGKNIVPCIKLIFTTLASQVQDSQEAQHSALFVLVNIIIFAILIRSGSIRHGLNVSKQYHSTPLALAAPTSVSESNGAAYVYSLPLPPDLEPVQEHQPPWSVHISEGGSRIKRPHPQTDGWPERQHGKGQTRRSRMSQGPFVAVNHVQEIHQPVHPEMLISSKSVNRDKECYEYMKDVDDDDELSIERIESFIMRHRERWARQQRQDSVQRRNQISWIKDL